MSESGTREPAAELGLLDATMIGMGAMIGAGVFVLTGLAAEITGPAVILVFLLNGVVTGFTGLAYAELSSSIPKSGGGYAFVEEIFSDRIAFQMGWMLWFGYMIAGALYALGFAANFIEWIHIYWSGLPDGAVLAGLTSWAVVYAFAIVALLIVLNVLSTAASGAAETAGTIIKVGILVVFSAFGAFAIDTGEFTPVAPDGLFAIIPAMGLTFIAFQGYDLISTVTEEVENPRENIPKAIFLSLTGTVIVYLTVVTISVGTLGAERLGEQGEIAIASAAGSFMPEIPILGPGSTLIWFGAVFSTFTALNAVVIASSRVAFAMGRDRLFPSRLGQIHHRFGTPSLAVIASATVMLGSVVFLPIQLVGNLSSFFFLLAFVLVNAAVIKLRRERPNMNRPYEMPYYPIPPILGIVFNIGIGGFLLVRDPLTGVLALGWLGLGAIVYYALDRTGYGGRRRNPIDESGESVSGSELTGND
ncbi:APC family permease [Halopenitus sp. H-Gu1]|uniref:APC family permease n=1 Tax=Halopenitus sp. H-Gu1 TaxID=3242697 RepID=UPI00359D8A5A